MLLASAAVGQALLALALLIARARTHLTYVPIAGLFAALAVIAVQPIAQALSPDLAVLGVALLLPAYLSLGPLFWLYVVALTQPTPWRPLLRDLAHFVPVFVAIVAVALIGALPAGTTQALVLRGEDASLFTGPDQKALSFAGYLIITIFAMILFWLAQSFVYMFKTLRRLVAYRRQLKDLFASNEQRELTWILGVLVTTAAIWMLSAVGLITENFFDLRLVTPAQRSAVVLVLIGLLALWALRQKPGFAGRYLDRDEIDAASKYERSALDEQRSQRIVQKLQTAMLNDQLYLQPGLSLPVVARHLGVSANYVSQTLNETLGQSFFDYVNAHRIDAAKPMLLDGQQAILDIAYAVGFNARSSFYAAFKRATGQTPGQFRKHARREVAAS